MPSAKSRANAAPSKFNILLPRDAAAPHSRLANDAVVTEDGPHPAVKLGANDTTVCRVNLADRATSLPFTPVMTGPLRTTMDNTTTTPACIVVRLRR
jgi:hypothetical protein